MSLALHEMLQKCFDDTGFVRERFQTYVDKLLAESGRRHTERVKQQESVRELMETLYQSPPSRLPELYEALDNVRVCTHPVDWNEYAKRSKRKADNERLKQDLLNELKTLGRFIRHICQDVDVEGELSGLPQDELCHLEAVFSVNHNYTVKKELPWTDRVYYLHNAVRELPEYAMFEREDTPLLLTYQ